MRYFTKDWYNDTVLAEMCFQIKPSHKAEKFNEKYFKSLYDAQKSWYVKTEKRTCKYTGQVFDKEAAEAEFDANFNENLEYVKSKLPSDILATVADVRLLAIGSASYEVRDAVTRFCGQVNRRCEQVRSRYEEECERLADVIGWYKINSLNLIAGSPLESIESVGEDLIITTSPLIADIAYKIVLSGANIVTKGENLVGATPLYVEILPTNNDCEIEINLLCSTEDGKSAELSVIARDVETEEIVSSI